MKPTIDLKPIFHRGAEQIGIYFKNDLKLNIATRKEAGGIWSQTNKCWYVPLNKEAFEKLKTALKDHALLNTTLLKKFLENRKTKTASGSSIVESPTGKEKALTISQTISAVNKHILPEMKQMLKLKAFSPSTVKTYINEMAQLLQA